ncbi:MAG: YqiA/YcfP family alpha/beta fold hydrolase [Capnocytophaga sp.]|nr:YqiA/YcfP family alpha/beta fold hydrolase [Capnocytophaga sp.]
MIKVLYLHGLDSFLQEDRREVLSQYCQIEAPVLDYLHSTGLFEQLLEKYKDITAIIGSSAGGLIAYYLAQKLQKPCLLFNPALSHHSQMPFPHFFDKNYTQYMQIVLGRQDEVISYEVSLKILLNDLSEKQDAEVHLINKMQHSYPISIFKQEVSYFFDKILHK